MLERMDPDEVEWKVVEVRETEEKKRKGIDSIWQRHLVNVD